MNNIEKKLMQAGLAEEKDFCRKGFNFSWIYIHFANSIAKMIIWFFVMLAIGLTTAVSGSVDLTLILVLISSIASVFKFKNALFANLFAVSALAIIPFYYTESIVLAATLSYVFYIGTISIYKNSDAFALILPISYFYIGVMVLEYTDFSYDQFLVLVSFINFALIFMFFAGQDKIRKSKYGRSYKLMVVELVLVSFGLSLYYEFKFLSLFWGKTSDIKLIYFQNIIYTVGNIFVLIKMDYLSKKYRILNGLLLVLSIKVPLIAFALFAYNLAEYQGFMELRKISYLFLLTSPFLLYYSFSINFVQKSIMLVAVGIFMLLIYIYLIKAGDKYND